MVVLDRLAGQTFLFAFRQSQQFSNCCPNSLPSRLTRAEVHFTCPFRKDNVLLSHGGGNGFVWSGGMNATTLRKWHEDP